MGSKSKTIKNLTADNLELKKTLTSTRSELTKTQTKLTKANDQAGRLEEGSSRASYGRGAIRRSG